MDQLLVEHSLPSGQQLQIIQGDITQQKVDAIVNAANSNLKHGGGVARVIVQKGGQVIQSESDEWVLKHGPVTHEEPAYTSAGSLICRYILHAVGPVWGEGDEDEKLSSAVYGSLMLGDKLTLSSIALPAISTGIFGFPKDRAARVILSSILNYFCDKPSTGLELVTVTLYDQPSTGLELVTVTLYDQPTVAAFLDVWNSMGVEKPN